MKIALRCAACLFALLWLTACGATRRPLLHAEIVEVPVVEYVPLPAALTEPLAAPAAPAFNCTLPMGGPAVCVHDGLMREVEWQVILARANADRATAAFLGAGADAAAFFRPGELRSPASQFVSRPSRINAPASGSAK